MTLGATRLTILWRGSLASCNYACHYCPFAKTEDSRSTLAADRTALERFTDWAESRPYKISILFTPWGEAMIRGYYRAALMRLSHAANVETVAVQTNLSCSVDWLEACNLDTAALWISYHPGETPRPAFLRKIERLHALGVRYSVGMVGLTEHLAEIEALRRDLPPAAYLWVNAFKRQAGYYSSTDLDRLSAIDPLFALNNRDYASHGRACQTGESVISVLADGTARRCHFLQQPIGNIYDADFEAALMPRPCAAERCRCHIGYSHLKGLELRALFGRGFLERRPESDVNVADAARAMARFDAGEMP
jgi:MoaA/NifB/PqqE/SkfB family radical SAM enzyme